MPALALADELALIRVQIDRLRQREHYLRQALIAAPEAARYGQWSFAQVTDKPIRVFDHRLLPQSLRDDPCYWRERRVTTVQCQPMPAAHRPDWSPPPAQPRAAMIEARSARM